MVVVVVVMVVVVVVVVVWWWWRWQHFTWEISVPTFSLVSLLTENFSLNLFSLIRLVHIATGTQVGILEY